MAEIHGFCDERFRPLEDAFRANLDSGLDKGASLAVTLGGEFIVDLWGGTRDYEMVTPWESDTVVRVFSTTKVMVVLMVLMLVDRGLLDLDEPIATYWPGFAKHGKGTITSRQVLVHRSGLPGFGCVVTFDDLGDPERSAAIIENAELWYEPGTISCYHAQTFGAILGEVITRVSGSRFDDFFEREISRPLGADFHFGLPADEAPRVSAIWPAEAAYGLQDPMAAAVEAELVAHGWVAPTNLPRVMASQSGLGNARALARVGTIVALGGEVEGKRYLNPEIIMQAGEEQSYAEDRALGWCRYGLGLGLDADDYPAPNTDHDALGRVRRVVPDDGSLDGDHERVRGRISSSPTVGLAVTTAAPQYWRLLGEIIRDTR